ncbi:MAG: C80 family cysteine peptidase [Planctomycetia bacterium]|nr:C80 family cysteine peptidase [Planctomycetia bacterium]
MSKYSGQLIVDGFRLQSERQRAKFLTDKAAAHNPPLPTESVLFPRAGQPGFLAARFKLTAALGKLDKHSRLYLIGHGNWKAQTLGGDTADTWATTLVNGGLPQIKLVSVTGCQAGRDLGSADDLRVLSSADSFASKLHAKLGALGVKVDLYARAYKVRIRSGGQGQVRGSKTTEGTYQRANSKILFTWEGAKQVRKWVDYTAKDDPDSWVDLDSWVFLQEMGGL